MEFTADLSFVVKTVTYIICLIAAICAVYYATSWLVNLGMTTGVATATFAVIQITAIAVFATSFGNDSINFWTNSVVALNNSLLLSYHIKKGKAFEPVFYIIFILIHATLAITYIH